MFRPLYWAFSLILLTTLFTQSVHADNQYFFQEEFDQERANNTLDSNKWTVFPNAAAGVTTIKETGGNLVTSQNNFTNQYPFIASKNPALPLGDFEAEIRFQYTHVTPFGTGIALSQNAPNIPTNDFGGLLALSIWQDNNIGLNLRIQYQSSVVYSIPISTDPHKLKVTRAGLKYKLYFDDTLAYSSPDNPVQVRYIWFGNPTLQSQIPDWTKFNVDYVRIQDTSKTPLILIPGIGGSELKAAEDTFWSAPDGHGGIFNHAYTKDEKVWLNTTEAAQPGDDDYFDILRMRSDGITSEANLELTGNLFAGAYQGAIDFFIVNRYELNKTLFVFPYDWRKDLSLTAPLLDQKINQIKEQTGSQKVDIVAHSMGGLVARNYISDPTRAQKIRKLFTLGTPHLGSVKFLKALRHGTCLLLEVGPFCLSIAPSEMQDVLQNFISGYELLPTQTYFNFYNGQDLHPLPFVDSRDIDNNGITGPLNYDQIKNLLGNLGQNTLLFLPSEGFHNLDNILTNINGVEVTNIVGSGFGTLGQIVEKYTIDFAGIKIPKKDELMINGDETVPLFSASLIDPSQNLSLLGDAKLFYVKHKHGELPKANPILNLIKNILDGNSEIPDGISDVPFPLNGKVVSVHSPVNIHVYDQNGNHTGPTPDGDFETNIPDSSYDSLEDAKFIWLPKDGVYNIVFESTGEGSFDFKIRNFQDNTNTDTKLYQDIPLTLETTGQAVFDTNLNDPPVINLDQNDDGNFDLQFQLTSQLSGEENFDQTPPVTEINLNGTPGNNNWFTSDVNIHFNASDDNSGVARTEYTLDDGQTVQEYNQPFTISTEGTYKLKVKSEDNAGNEEVPKEIEIKIDKTIPEAKIIIDQNTLNLIIIGIDENETSTESLNTSTTTQSFTNYNVSDLAGNTIHLFVNKQIDGGTRKFLIKSIQYDNQQPFEQPFNLFSVNKTSKDSFYKLEQKFTVDVDKIILNYNSRDNKSNIYTRENGVIILKETKPNFIHLQVYTENGNIKYKY